MRDITHRTRQRFSSASSAHNRDIAPWIPHAVAILLVLVTLAVFGQIYNSEFVLWDDGLHVFENPYLQSLTFDNILAIWREPYGELYIPLTYTLWALTAAASRVVQANPTAGAPLAPQFFHTLNLLVYLLSVLVVWRLVRLLLDRLTPRPSLIRLEWAAGAGALLFAVHPTHVESVAWVTGFKDVLYGFLACVAVWQYLAYARGDMAAPASGKPARGKAHRSLGHFWLATGVFVLALLAKPTAVVIPVVVGVLDIWGWPQTWRRRRPALLAWLGLAVLWGLFASQIQPPASGAFIPPLWARFLIAGDTVSFYLYKLGVPVWLGPDYGRTPEVMLAQPWLLCLTGLAPLGLAVWLWYKRTRVPWLVAAAGVFVAGLLPNLGLVPFAFQAFSTVADRYMYIALLGPAFALAWGLVQSRQHWLGVGCVVVLGMLGIGSAWQTGYWHDSTSLFEHELTVHPGSSVAYNILGMVLTAQNRHAEATRYYIEAVRLWPRNTDAHNNLGNALHRQGKSQEAIEQYMEALRLKPNHPEAHHNLGNALADQEHLAEAISHYTKALYIQPAYPRARYALGNALLRQGQTQEAIEQYMKALRLQPNYAEAHHNLGVALADQGRVAEAISHYTAALRLRPRHVNAHYHLGVSLAQQGRLTEAREHFSEVLRLDPNHAAARRFLNNMANQ
jgi:tetratricopeptide (TPR) repeat protein